MEDTQTNIFDTYRKRNFKYFIPTFIILCIIISLFPPFEWGNEKLRTLNERKTNSVSDKLPIKGYDLIFSSNKKYFGLGEYEFEGKIYQETYYKLDNILGDAISYHYKNGIDTFKTHYLIAYKKTKEMLLAEKEEQLKRKRSRNSNDFSKYIKSIRLKPKQYFILGTSSDYESVNNKSIDFRLEDLFIEDSKNFNQIKDEYYLNPKAWTYRGEYKIDSIKNYRLYKIKKPNYYLLSREVIIPELVINYILSFFISLSFSFIIVRFKK